MTTWEKWKELLYRIITTKEWAIFINIARAATFILIAIILYILVKEIEAVKLLAYDPCQICMNKTGAVCSIFNTPFVPK